jgi:hypothetical protein
MPIIRYFVVVGLVLGALIWMAGAFVSSPTIENASAAAASQRRSDKQAGELARQKTAAIYHVPVDARTLVPAKIAPATDDQGSRKAAAKTSGPPSINSREKRRTKKTVTRRQRQDGTQVVEQGNPATRTLLEF